MADVQRLRPDPLAGLSFFHRRKKERDDADFLRRYAHNMAAPEAIAQPDNTFAGTDALRAQDMTPYDGGEIDAIICARLDLDHPLYFPDNLFADCAECGCNLQYRPIAPQNAPKICLSCAARKVAEELA